eukprot:321435_1
MAEIIIDCTLNLLCEQIIDKKVNGRIVNENNVIFASWVKEETGWDTHEVSQINAVLLKHKTLSSQEIETKIHTRFRDAIDMKMAEDVRQEILQSKVDLAKLQLKIKHTETIDKEQEIFMDILDDIEQNKYSNLPHNLVQEFYAVLSEAFQTSSEWTCYNCSNLNSCIDNCRLCGITSMTSVVFALKDVETYGAILMAENNKSMTIEKETLDTNTTKDEALSLDIKIDLNCPDSVKMMQCPAITRLSKYLCVYQDWINQIRSKHNGKNNIEYTTTADIKLLSNDTFYQIVTKAMELTKNITEDIKSQIIQLLETEIITITSFATLNRRKFLKLMTENTKLKMSICTKIYKHVRILSKTQAHTKKFGKFFSEVEVEKLIEDYHHILDVHMTKGSKISKESVFIYFRYKLQCDDNECSSLSRNEQRHFALNDNDEKEETKHIDIDVNSDTTENIFSREQYYVQSTLDVIHSYFVHHDWKSDIDIDND